MLVLYVLLKDLLNAHILLGIYGGACFEFGYACTELLVLELELEVLGLCVCEALLQLLDVGVFLPGKVKKPLLFVRRGLEMRR